MHQTPPEQTHTLTQFCRFSCVIIFSFARSFIHFLHFCVFVFVSVSVFGVLLLVFFFWCETPMYIVQSILCAHVRLKNLLCTKCRIQHRGTQAKLSRKQQKINQLENKYSKRKLIWFLFSTLCFVVRIINTMHIIYILCAVAETYSKEELLAKWIYLNSFYHTLVGIVW